MPRRTLFATSLLVTLASCGGPSSSDGITVAPEPHDGATEHDDSGAPGGPGGIVGSSDASTSSGSAGDAAGSADAGGGADGGPVVTPPPGSGPVLPAAAGACPELTSGTLTFHPKTGGARTAVVTMTDTAKTTPGPLILYWFSTGSSPAEAQYGLPTAAITGAGGIVVAPNDVSGAGQFPWLNNVSEHEDLADEIVACVAQKVAFDHARIHAIGFSAGGLMTTHLSYARSSYLASVAAYSGGSKGTFQEPNNKFAAMIMTGGTSDNVFNQDFLQSSQDWQNTLKAAGHFAMLCNHGGGHTIPKKLVPGVWQFFVDHPFGRNPSPYAGGHLPGAISPPCVE